MDTLEECLEEIELLDESIAAQKKLLQAEKETLTMMQKDRETLSAKVANEMVENGCTDMEHNKVKWSVRNTPQKVIISDESLLPSKFIREKVTTAPDKVLLKASLKNGKHIQGAYLNNGSITLVSKGII